MKWPMVVLGVCLLGCSGKATRQGSLNAFTRGCKAGLQNNALKVDCACLARELTADMSDAELNLWIHEPQLFSKEEQMTLTTRNAMSCLRTQLVGDCALSGSSRACECMIDGFLGKLSGDEFMEVAERFRNGAPLPPGANNIRTACISQFGGR
jgi:hypothetical protein